MLVLELKVVDDSKIISRIINSGRLFRPLKFNNLYSLKNVALGSRTNQSFVTIPFNRLIEQIKDKAGKYEGLEVKIVEESYTSKTDHLSLEEMTHQDYPKGKRVKRGLFKSACGKTLNADINGAIGILRKGNAITDEQLILLRDRGDVVSPKVFRLNL